MPEAEARLDLDLGSILGFGLGLGLLGSQASDAGRARWRSPPRAAVRSQNNRALRRIGLALRG